MKFKCIFPWLLAGIVSVSGLIGTIYFLPQGLEVADNQTLVIVLSFMFGVMLPLMSSCLAALIVTRQPGNMVGWLMMVTAMAAVMSSINFQPASTPTTLTPGMWLLLWFENWGWLLFGIPSLLILLNFPNGHPPSSRWRWVNLLAFGIILLPAVYYAFAIEMGPSSGEWVVVNPLGFIPIIENKFDFLGTIANVATMIVAGASIASLFFRFRSAKRVERQQIKWLLFTGALLIIAFIILLITYEEPPSSLLPFLLVGISLLMIPFAIATAILRYRLYDIDLIIRRTLQYTILTALLAMVYFGSVVLLQSLIGQFTGEQSPAVIVISTLAIVVLFNPLRTRIQDFIDKRFYRNKYDAERALAEFAATARDEVELEALTSSLIDVVAETMQPERLSLWLRQESGDLFSVD